MPGSRRQCRLRSSHCLGSLWLHGHCAAGSLARPFPGSMVWGCASCRARLGLRSLPLVAQKRKAEMRAVGLGCSPCRLQNRFL